MTDILICGACGAMGKTLLSVLQENANGFRAVCGVDIHPTPLSIPVYENFSLVTEKLDILIDFSSPTGLIERLEFAKSRNIGAVIATTGFSDSDFLLLERYAKKLPIFQSANFSPAVYFMKRIINGLSYALPSFDLSIVETHHKNKKDAPSGTAKTLAQDRENATIVSLRGGTVVGVHQAIFFGEDETLEITHRVQSKKIFALGAITASRFLLDKNEGLYGMDDIYKTAFSE